MATKFTDILGGLGQKWNELDPILKTTLLGAGASGLAGGLTSALQKAPNSPEGRSERRKRIVSNALITALLGGGAVAGLGYGGKALSEAMPPGSKPPLEATGDFLHSLSGRLGLAGLFSGAAATSKKLRESSNANNLAGSLANRLRQGFGHGKDVMTDPRRYLEDYFGKKPTSPADRTDAFAALQKMRGGDKDNVIRNAIASGVDVDPLLRPKNLETAVSKLPGILGKTPALLRRTGLKLPGLAGLGFMTPDLWDLGKNLVGAGDDTQSL
jgi:hypothetical protein